jgi:ribosome-associated toxin RatA of RatAB toxin-antitoxin module
MGLQWAEHTIEIDASPDEVFDAITDYETFSKWQSAVIDAKVESRQKRSKLGEVVSYEIDGKVRTVRYTLKYNYDRPERIGWDYIEGEGLNRLEGGYEIKPAGAGATAKYRVGIDVTGVPGPILKRVQKETVRKANEDLKAEAERRHRSGAKTAEHETAPPPGDPGGPGGLGAADDYDASGGSHPFDMLPAPVSDLAKLPGKIMVKVGKRLGG